MERQPNEQRPDSGYSMIELVISSVILGMMIYAVSTLSVSGGQAQEYARRLSRVTEVTQEVIDEMRLELVSAVRIFGNNSEGNANLAIFNLNGAPAALTGLRLPTISVDGMIEPDTAGNEITGNQLFFAKLAWTDRFQCTSGNDYMVDVYRWVRYYMTPEGGGPDPSHPIGLNIVRIESEPMVDATAIDRIANAADQAEVLLHLLNATADINGNTHSPVELVWARGQLPSVVGTFRQINPADGSLSLTPLVPRADPWQVNNSDPQVRGLLSYRHHSVASIYARQSFGVGTYGLVSTAGDGFPHGFEIQVVGPSSARSVLIHLVCSSTRRTGHFAWADMQLAVDARDL